MLFYMVKEVYATEGLTIVQLPCKSTAWEVGELGMQKTYKFTQGADEIAVELPEGMHLLKIELREKEA